MDRKAILTEAVLTVGEHWWDQAMAQAAIHGVAPVTILRRMLRLGLGRLQSMERYRIRRVHAMINARRRV